MAIYHLMVKGKNSKEQNFPKKPPQISVLKGVGKRMSQFTQHNCTEKVNDNGIYNHERKQLDAASYNLSQIQTQIIT